MNQKVLGGTRAPLGNSDTPLAHQSTARRRLEYAREAHQVSLYYQDLDEQVSDTRGTGVCIAWSLT